MRPLRSLAFVVNSDKAGAAGIARELVAIARREGIRVKLTRRQFLPERFLRGWDACCVIGGDGTLLGVVPEAARWQVPIIGVNRGGLGFLTTLSADEARANFAELIRGGFRLDRRAMLDCRVSGTPPALALNDVLIKAAMPSGLVRLEVRADGELVTDYLCDGLIFSTPTGSTAYNLSAGGPIIHPEAKVIAMTPICPHTLSNRAIIFRDQVRLQIFIRTAGVKLMVAIDGQRHLAAHPERPVEISIAKRRLELAQGLAYAHFSVMRTKLRWSGGLAEKP